MGNTKSFGNLGDHLNSRFFYKITLNLGEG